MTQPSPPAPRATERPARGTGRRWLTLAGIALLLIAGGLALLFSSLSLQLDDARSEVEAHLSRLAGQPVHVDGSVSFSLLPRPEAVLSDVRLTTQIEDEALALTVDRLETDFALLPALLGRAEIKSVAMIRPELRPMDAAEARAQAPQPDQGVRRQEARQPGIAASDASNKLRGFLVRFEGLRELEVQDGLFQLPGRDDSVSNVNMTVEWPGGTDAARLLGSAVWNGQPVTVDTRLDRPIAFTEGESTPLKLFVSSPALEVGFDGAGAGGETLRLSGNIRISTSSLTRALNWLGRPTNAMPDFGSFLVETRIELLNDRVSFSAAQLNLGGDIAHGAMEAVLRKNEATAISGTLAFSQLDMGRFSRAIAPPPRNILDYQRPLRVGFLRDLDLDLRLSAEQADLGHAKAREIAATIKAMNGKGILDIGDMAVLGGRANVRISLDVREREPTLFVQSALRDVDMAQMATAIGRPLPVSSGRGDLELILRGPATNWAEIAFASRSDVSLRIRNGQLAGFARPATSTTSTPPSSSAASPPESFQLMELKAQTSGPRMRMESASVQFSDGAEAMAGGTADLRDGRMAIAGEYHATRREASGVSNSFTTSKPIGFKMDGEWPDPAMTIQSVDGPT